MTKTADRRTQITRTTWIQDAYQQGWTDARPSAAVGLEQESRHFEGMAAVAKANVARVRLVLSDLDRLADSYNLDVDQASYRAVMLARRIVVDILVVSE